MNMRDILSNVACTNEMRVEDLNMRSYDDVDYSDLDYLEVTCGYITKEKNVVTNKIINGDLLEIKEGVIIHQVNNKFVMGAGIAKIIRFKYKNHYNDYMASKLELGSVVTTRINTEPFFGVIGIVAQNGYGYNKRYTDYIAFENCLIKIAELYNKNTSINYYMPYGIGCGLAGGNWNKVLNLIIKHCPFIILVKK